MTMDDVGNALHAYLDQRLEQLDRAYDEAEAAYLDLPRKQQSAREEEHHAMFMEWQPSGRAQPEGKNVF
jgi:hypothetical protein